MIFAEHRHKKNDDWWIEVLFEALFIIIIIFVICLMTQDYSKMSDFIEGGNIILSSFMIVLPTLIKFYSKKSISEKNLKLLLLLIGSCFWDLSCYVIIQVRDDISVMIIYLVSLICFVSSMIISWTGKKQV